MSTEEISRALENIRVLGRAVEDIEGVRIANGNRVVAQVELRGDVIPELTLIQVELVRIEDIAVKQLENAMVEHPLADWADGIRGLGMKSLARLLSEVGDPGERPNPYKLYTYCGFGESRRRRKGMTREELMKMGNPDAKKRVWLIARRFVRTPGSPYREVYDEGRERYREKKHEVPCVRCGPSGRPAPPGSEWSDGHKHAAAIRLVAKKFLLDLWLAAREASA